MNYRGITVACATYKLYCSVLNNRLTKWVEHNDILLSYSRRELELERAREN